MKVARKPARRSSIASRTSPPLSLAMRIERLEKQLLFNKSEAVPTSAVASGPGPRFINLDASGKPTTGEHVAVYQTETGLIWTAAPLRDGADLSHTEAVQAATEVRLLGHSDWRAPSIRELLSIIDYDRFDPAVDAAHFKGPYGWTWTGTTAKAPAGYAWYVGLDDGYSLRLHQDGRVRALAVRVGQQLGLRL